MFLFTATTNLLPTCLSAKALKTYLALMGEPLLALPMAFMC